VWLQDKYRYVQRVTKPHRLDDSSYSKRCNVQDWHSSTDVQELSTYKEKQDTVI
jgi:hypothetical protein